MTGFEQKVLAKSVPAAAVRRIGRTLLGLIIGRKGYVGGEKVLGTKSQSLTLEGFLIGFHLSTGEESRMFGAEVKFTNPKQNSKSEGSFLDR